MSETKHDRRVKTALDETRPLILGAQTMRSNMPTRKHAAHKPDGHARGHAPSGPQAWIGAAVFLFDVEGTLVDAVMPTLLSWRTTLARFGHDVSLADLHRLSGMDGHEMLAHLVPAAAPRDRDAMLDAQGRLYRAEFLSQVRALPHVRELFEALKHEGRKVAIATDSDKSELAHYLALAQIEDLTDAQACGDEVRRGKPHASLVEIALKRVRAAGKHCVMVGDTPSDAEAARRAGILAVGLLSGHFSEADLRDAGCVDVRRDPAALLDVFEAACAARTRQRGAA